MINRTITLAIGLLTATTALAASKHQHTYNWVSAGTTDIEVPVDFGPGLSGDIEATTNTAEISYSSADGVLLQLNYSDGEVDRVLGVDPGDFGEKVDVRMIGALVGGVRYYSPQTSVWGGIGYTYTKLETRFLGSADSDGYRFGVGARHSITPIFEVNVSGFVVHEEPRDIDEEETDFEIALGFRVRPIDWLSVGASAAYMLDNEVEAWQADVRIEF